MAQSLPHRAYWPGERLVLSAFGLCLALGEDLEDARAKAKAVAKTVTVHL
jgi:hypothetical protein